MKERWRRRGRGAISIFLIIIFLAQYVLCGLLVDGARQRMANAMAESALDSASMSVLSYYNQLVYDLYGLMATDSMDEEAIQGKLKSYVERTLGVTETNDTLVKTLLELFKDVTGEAPTAKPFDGYDFQVNVTASTDVSLANTDFVEYQLIEHMKYRAPIQMLNGDNGLLSKLGNLSEVAERLELAKKKSALSKECGQKENAANAAETLKGIDTYIGKVRAFLANPTGWDGTSTAGSNPAASPSGAVKKIVEDITDHGIDMANKYLEEWDAYRVRYELYLMECESYDSTDPESVEPVEPEEPKWRKNDAHDDWADGVMPKYGTNGGHRIEGLNSALTKVEQTYAKLYANVNALKTEATKLLGEIDAEVASYKSYSEKLNGAYTDKAGGGENANAATVYIPEADLAEANAGQLLKNRPFLSYMETFTQELLTEGTGTLFNALDEVVNGGGTHGFMGMSGELASNMTVVEGCMLSEEYSLPGTICAKVSSCMNAEDWGMLPGNLDQMYYALTGDAIPNVSAAQVDVTVDGSKAKDEAEKEEVDTSSLRDIDEDDLKVDYTAVESGDPASLSGMELDDSMGSDDADKLLEGAGNVLNFLMGLLEGARDNLYVNQYITYYFPNYVDNYKLKSTDPKVAKSAQKFNEGKEYADYCASQVEVEYVLTGDHDAKGNVLKVQAMLLGIRTSFNLIAIFTDSAKVSQANAIAAAAGPFAPLVSVALLIGWAVAESVIDVQQLCSGEEVPLFKQGKDWFLSVEGAVEKAIKTAAKEVVSYGVSELQERVNSISGKVTNVANQAIFKAYEAASGGVDAGVKAAKDTISDWEGNLSVTLDAAGADDEVKSTLTSVSSSFSTAATEFSSSVTKELGSVKDKAVQKVAHAAETATKTVNNKISDLGDKITDKVSESVVSWVSDKIPVGKVVSLEKTPDASKFPGMTYMDYIQIFLLLENQTTKVQRIQSLVQANIRYKEGKSGDKKFKMAESYGAISAHLDGTVKFLFMSEAVVPATVRQNGRLKVAADSMVSY